MKKAPGIALYQLFKIGENDFYGQRYVATLSPQQLLKHLFICGITGSGKTTTMIYLMKQIMENGYGLMFADPHGDAADLLLCYVPESRYQDVIYLDLADVGFPLGINLFKARTELEKSLLKADLTAIIRRFSTSWGDQMNGLGENAFGACIENERPYNILHIPRFLTDLSFRRRVLETVTDPQIRHYWEKVYPLLIGKSLAPILTRLGSLLRSRAIRNIFAQKDGLDFEEILESGKILIVKAPLGLIGSNDSFTLCLIMLAKMQQHIWARQVTGIEQRRYFYVALDELKNLVTPSIASMLASTRKFGVGLILAGADLLGMWEQDREVCNAIISHPGARICHRQGDYDARKLEEGFSFFDARDLQGLAVGEAIMSIEGRSNDFNIRAFQPPKVDPETIQAKRDFFLKLTRERYGASREKVEAEIERDKVWYVEHPGPDKGQKKSKEKGRSEDKKKAPGQARKKSLPPENLTKLDPSTFPDSENGPEVTEGKGGYQHRYLQHFIKNLAEDHGFLAVLEEPTADGSGSVDVGLKKGEHRIAIEISITTPFKHEFMNIRKCLNDGYGKVILCSPNSDTLNKVRSLIEGEMSEAAREKVSLLKPEELLFQFQQEGEGQVEEEKRVKGYKVKIERQGEEKKSKGENK